MPTIAELAAELGIPAETLAAKGDVIKKWDGYLSEGASSKVEAERKMAEAVALKQAVDDNIREFGINETTMAQLQASNASYKAALETLKKQGFTGIDLPEIATSPATTINDPAKELLTKVQQGFTQIGQVMNVQNRHFQIFGKALPDSPAALADEAAQRRMTVEAWAEQKYGFAAETQRQQAEAQKAHDAKVAAEAVKSYQEKNPNTAGNPNLNGGVPSNYGNMPKPRDGKTIREFSSMSSREKIGNALQRATEAAKSQVTQ